jgi:chromosome segregation ATPase
LTAQIIRFNPREAVTYPITEADIEATREKYGALTANTPAGYEQVRLAIADIRDMRGRVEARRKELKADALEFGRLVDAGAKKFTALLEEIEAPLKLKKAAVDEEKARKKAEEEERKRQELEAKIAAERAIEEARLKAERDAEEARLAAEREQLRLEREAIEKAQAEERARQEEARKAQEAKLAEERAELDRLRREEAERQRVARESEEKRQAEERAKLEAERAQLEAQRREQEERQREIERREFERQAKERAEQEARERVAREAREAEERRRAEEERAAAEAARLEGLKPDVEKLRGFAGAVRALKRPELSSAEAREALATAVSLLNQAVETLEDFAADNTKATEHEAE